MTNFLGEEHHRMDRNEHTRCHKGSGAQGKVCIVYRQSSLRALASRRLLEKKKTPQYFTGFSIESLTVIINERKSSFSLTNSPIIIKSRFKKLKLKYLLEYINIDCKRYYMTSFLSSKCPNFSI